VGQVLALVMKVTPKYIVVSSQPELNYVFLTELFLKSVNDLEHQENETLEVFLNLHEKDADFTVNVLSINPLKDSKVSEIASTLSYEQEIIIKRRNRIVGIIDRKMPDSSAVYHIKVSFFQSGTYLEQIEINTQIVKKSLRLRTTPTASDISLKIETAPVEPDMSLIINELSVSPNYEYEVLLFAPKFLTPYAKVGKIIFKADPEAQFREIFQDIESHDIQSSVAETAIASKGADLYDKIFPDDLKRFYWEIHDRLKSIRVISDEPWIPWEILKPWRHINGGRQEDGFLCEQYSFSRWIAGESIKEKNQIKNGKIVVPLDTDLPGALKELEWINDFAGKVGLSIDSISSFEEVISSLKTGGFDLLHFSTHGRYNKNYSNHSTIELEQNLQLRPENISGVATTFGESNPLVILNACQTGQRGFSLTGIGSWAKQFVAAGASGFIGTLWSVSDSTALRFTKNLYEKLASGSTLDDAVRNARNAAREKGDPSWLAYTLYTQPNSEVKLGSK